MVCLAVVGAASQYSDAILVSSSASRNASRASSDQPHYGNPYKGNCDSDESNQCWGSDVCWCSHLVQGDGVGDCPKDVPVGMTAALFLNGDGKSGCCAHECANKTECGYPHDPAAICFNDGGGKCAYASESENGCKLSDCMSGPGCFAMTGGWVLAIVSLSANQTVEVDVGVSKSYSVDENETWGFQVTSSVEQGFDIQDPIFGENKTVSGQVSAELGASYSGIFTMDTVVKRTFQFDQAGRLWQWQWQIGTVCGPASVFGMDLVLTDGFALDPPCCVPQWFANPAEPHGKCNADSEGNVYDLCMSTTTTTTAQEISIRLRMYTQQCVAVEGPDDSYPGYLAMKSCDGSASQRFTVEHGDDGWSMLHPSGNQSLCVVIGSNADVQPCQQGLDLFHDFKFTNSVWTIETEDCCVYVDETRPGKHDYGSLFASTYAVGSGSSICDRTETSDSPYLFEVFTPENGAHMQSTGHVSI